MGAPGERPMPDYIRNRRRTPRVPIRCLVVGALPDGGVWASRTDDLSAKGCQLVLPDRLAPGAEVALTVSDDRVEDGLEVAGRVAWVSTSPPWRAGVTFEPADAGRSLAWFDRLVAAHPGLGGFRRAPERVPVEAEVFLADPPPVPVELRPEELAVLDALGTGCTAGALRDRLGERWAGAEGAFFCLLARRILTLTRAAAVPAQRWAPILARYR